MIEISVMKELKFLMSVVFLNSFLTLLEMFIQPPSLRIGLV